LKALKDYEHCKMASYSIELSYSGTLMKWLACRLTSWRSRVWISIKANNFHTRKKIDCKYNGVYLIISV